VVVAVGWGVEPAAVGQRRWCCDSGVAAVAAWQQWLPGSGWWWCYEW
nr:hypothetical protein [Tanacetum cinerariifolium]